MKKNLMIILFLSLFSGGLFLAYGACGGNLCPSSKAACSVKNTGDATAMMNSCSAKASGSKSKACSTMKDMSCCADTGPKCSKCAAKSDDSKSSKDYSKGN